MKLTILAPAVLLLLGLLQTAVSSEAKPKVSKHYAVIIAELTDDDLSSIKEYRSGAVLARESHVVPGNLPPNWAHRFAGLQASQQAHAGHHAGEYPWDYGYGQYPPYWGNPYDYYRYYDNMNNNNLWMGYYGHGWPYYQQPFPWIGVYGSYGWGYPGPTGFYPDIPQPSAPGSQGQSGQSGNTPAGAGQGGQGSQQSGGQSQGSGNTPPAGGNTPRRT